MLFSLVSANSYVEIEKELRPRQTSGERIAKEGAKVGLRV